MMNKWIIKMMGGREKIIRDLGGFSSVDAAIDWIKREDMIKRNEILTLAVKRLFNTISGDDILKMRPDGEWIFEGKTMPEAVRKQIIAEAGQFINTKLWKVLQADVKWQANRKMFLEATDVMQMAGGKFWMYTLDCFRTRLESLSKSSPIFNK